MLVDPFREGAVAPRFQAFIPPAAAALLRLDPAACRWPIGDVDAPGFRFCAAPRRRGCYCAAHGRLAERRRA